MNSKKVTKSKLPKVGEIAFKNKNIGFTITIPDNWKEIKNSSFEDLNIDSNTLTIFQTDKLSAMSIIFSGFSDTKTFKNFFDDVEVDDKFNVLYKKEKEINKLQVKEIIIKAHDRKILNAFTLINGMVINFTINIDVRNKLFENKGFTSDPNFKLMEKVLETLKTHTPVNPPIFIPNIDMLDETVEEEPVKKQSKKLPTTAETYILNDCKYRNILLPDSYLKYVYEKEGKEVYLNIINTDLYFSGMDNCFRYFVNNEKVQKLMEKHIFSNWMTLHKYDLKYDVLTSKSYLAVKYGEASILIDIEKSFFEEDLKAIFNDLINELEEMSGKDFISHEIYPTELTKKEVTEEVGIPTIDPIVVEGIEKKFKDVKVEVPEQVEDYLPLETIIHKDPIVGEVPTLTLSNYDENFEKEKLEKEIAKERKMTVEFLNNAVPKKKKRESKITVEFLNKSVPKKIKKNENKITVEFLNKSILKKTKKPEKITVEFLNNSIPKKGNKLVAAEVLIPIEFLNKAVPKKKLTKEELTETVEESFEDNYPVVEETPVYEEYNETVENTEDDFEPVEEEQEEIEEIEYDLANFKVFFHNIDGHNSFKFLFPSEYGEKEERDFNVFDIVSPTEIEYRVFIFKCETLEKYQDKLEIWMNKNIISSKSELIDSYESTTESDIEIKTYILGNGRFYKVSYIEGYLIAISGLEDEDRMLFADIALDNVEIGEDNRIFVEQEDRKNRSISILKEQGIPYLQELPPVVSSFEVNGKTLEDIVKRAIVLCVTCNFASDIVTNKKKRYIKESKKFFTKLIDKYNVKDCMTKEELDLFDNMKEDQAIQISWQFEGFNVLLWALGLIDTIDDPVDLVDPDSLTAIVSACDSYRELLNKCSLRSVDEILDLLDLTFRYNWYCVESKINGEEPVINPEVVVERQRALEWMISEDKWDEIEINT